MAVDRIVMRPAGDLAGIEMGDDLMAEEIEVDPVIGMAPLRTAERAAVKGAGRVEIVDRKGEVEGRRAASSGRSLARTGAAGERAACGDPWPQRVAPPCRARLSMIPCAARGRN